MYQRHSDCFCVVGNEKSQNEIDAVGIQEQVETDKIISVLSKL